jgi:hypothetical protein
MPHEYVPPSEIDGSPVEVEAASILQLREVADEAFVQIKNAWMTRQLDRAPSLSPEQMATDWEESDRLAECHRIRVLLSRL